MGKPFTAQFRKMLLKATLCAAFAGVVGPLLPQPAGAQEKPAAYTEEDVTTPEACAANADPVALSATLPEISRDLDVLSALPLTGSLLFAQLQDPANNIQTCLFPEPRGDTKESTFDDEKHTARVGRGVGGGLAFHEYFHGLQFITKADDHKYNLTVADAQVFFLMKEASAIAYDMATRREAKDRGLVFPASHVYVEKLANGDTLTTTWNFTSTSPANQAVFDAAYDAALKQSKAPEAQDREAEALAAGGQAVVRRLLAGKDLEWKRPYVALAKENITLNKGGFQRKGAGADYQSARDAAFLSQGTVSPAINFIPPEYLGAGAAPAIAKCRSIMGFAAPVAAAPKHQAGV